MPSQPAQRKSGSLEQRKAAGILGREKQSKDILARLIKGDAFDFKNTNKSSPTARLVVHEVPITVPRNADLQQDVFVKFDIAAEGEMHPHRAYQGTPTNIDRGDPAFRFAVELKYTDKTGQEQESWWTTKGLSNAKKINSLVDEIEERPPGLDRRYIARNVSAGRPEAGYTDQKKRKKETHDSEPAPKKAKSSPSPPTGKAEGPALKQSKLGWGPKDQ